MNRHYSLNKRIAPREIENYHARPVTKTKNAVNDLDGWTYIINYGLSHIYANGTERCLVDPKTGQITFKYRVLSGRGYSLTKKSKGAKPGKQDEADRMD